MTKNLPQYIPVHQSDYSGTLYSILTHDEVDQVPEALRATFLADGEATHVDGNKKTHFLTPHKASTTTISSNVFVHFSLGSSEEPEYLGRATDFLSSPYKFWRKSQPYTPPIISIFTTTPYYQRLINLTETRNRTREWGNGRGDIEGSPQFFRKIAQQFAQRYKLGITVIAGDDLLKQGFRLMHAVGRASDKEPVFVNLAYNGNPDSTEWTAFVGKGVCFDSGGLNIKTAAGMLGMFLDKLGAVTVLSAFETVVKEKAKINLTCSIGLVENFINENNYRPSDIITSRKGLTVEIGNTDAEGRLVLADCMNWVQEKFKVKVLIELSTLTGAMITCLGSDATGLFSNDDDLIRDLKAVGQKVHERSWHLPCNNYHKDIISPKHCDLTNNSGRGEAGASQAAAFLKEFVEQGVKWAHLDIAGTSMVNNAATGWGSRLLVEYACQTAIKNKQKQEHHGHHEKHV